MHSSMPVACGLRRRPAGRTSIVALVGRTAGPLHLHGRPGHMRRPRHAGHASCTPPVRNQRVVLPFLTSQKSRVVPTARVRRRHNVQSRVKVNTVIRLSRKLMNHLDLSDILLLLPFCIVPSFLAGTIQILCLSSIVILSIITYLSTVLSYVFTKRISDIANLRTLTLHS